VLNKIKNFKSKIIKDRLSSSYRWQNRLDRKLVYGLNKKILPNFRQLIKLPEVLSSSEKKILTGLIVLLISSISLWSWRFYQSHLEVLPTAGGEYTEGLIGSPIYINPILQTTDVERDLSSLIFSGLMRRDKNQQLITDLAERYDISEDQKNYTFYLRQDVFWHDGEPFVADDIIFTIESIQNPEYKSPLFVSLSGVVVKKIDEHTVKFVLEEPYTPFLNILTVGILPEHLWSHVEPASANLASYNLEPIGTGAWKFVKLTKDKASGFVKSLELEKFDNYYQTRPYLNKLIFKFYPDFVQAIDALKNKNVQGLSFVPKEEKDQISKLKYVNFATLNLPQYTSIFFNQKNNKALRDINVRQAFAFSIDKKQIIQKAIASEGEPIYGPILPGHVGYNPNLEKYDLDIDKANQILDDAKWKKISPEEVIKKQEEEYLKKITDLDKQIKKKQEEESTPPEESETNGTVGENDSAAVLTIEELQDERLKLAEKLANLEQLKEQEFFRQKGDLILKIKLTTIDRAENITAVELVKEMWSKVGAQVELEIIDKTRIQKDIIKPRNYEALLFGEVVGFDPDPYPFWHSSQNQDPGLNLAIFSNKEVDKLLEEARQSTNEKVRNDKYVHFQNILVKELPAIFLYSPTYTYPISTKIQGFDVSRISLPSDRFNNIEEWYVETRGKFRWK
jgi:ABC-type transport system substrate-binding protein